MLDRQINLFKIDTDCFLYPDEQKLADKKMLYRQELFDLQSYKKDSKYYNLSKKEREKERDKLNKKIKESEKEYKTYIKKSAQKHLKYNETHKDKHIRSLNRDKLYYKNKDGNEKVNLRKVVSMFESTLSRSMGVRKDELTFDIFILEIYYYDIAKDLILNGFDYDGKHYVYFSSSAGQIRTKKAVFVNEEKYSACEMKITCGLTVDHINEHGGMNVNKYLAYKALANSATDLWEDVLGVPFDIDRCIVVDDFETMVQGKMDNIDYQTYEITRGVEQEVPIPHTDGCGMILPELSDKNFMVRLPYIKGLLGVWDYKKFCRDNNHSGDVKDIWGDHYNIFDDNIQVIFTKSQLKMH